LKPWKKKGWVIPPLQNGDFVANMEKVLEVYKGAVKITLVMDNLGTHKLGALYETFKPDVAKKLWDRFEFIYTPNMSAG